MKKKYIIWYQCYYIHPLINSVSSVCGIFLCSKIQIKIKNKSGWPLKKKEKNPRGWQISTSYLFQFQLYMVYCKLPEVCLRVNFMLGTLLATFIQAKGTSSNQKKPRPTKRNPNLHFGNHANMGVLVQKSTIVG